MENSFFGKDNNEDVEGIKNDIQSLVHRLGNLKDQSAVALTEQIEGLSSAIGDLKDKGVEIGRDNMALMYAATRKNPPKNVNVCFWFRDSCLLPNEKKKLRKVLKVLLSEVLDYYLKPKVEKTAAIYLSYIVAALGLLLLIITNVAYFYLTRSTVFWLIVSITCCFIISAVIYAIGYYIKQHSQHKFLQSLPISSFLVENILKKIPTIIKNKPLNSYGYFAASAFVLTTAALVIYYQYVKKPETGKKTN